MGCTACMIKPSAIPNQPKSEGKCGVGFAAHMKQHMRRPLDAGVGADPTVVKRLGNHPNATVETVSFIRFGDLDTDDDSHDNNEGGSVQMILMGDLASAGG